MLFKDGYYYKYGGDRKVEKFKEFIAGSHDTSTGTKMPWKKDWMDHTKFFILSVLEVYVQMLDQNGFAEYSRNAKVIFVISFFSLGFVLLFVLVRSLKHAVPRAAPKSDLATAEAQKKVGDAPLKSKPE